MGDFEPLHTGPNDSEPQREQDPREIYEMTFDASQLFGPLYVQPLV
jgi:hypothetical protein